MTEDRTTRRGGNGRGSGAAAATGPTQERLERSAAALREALLAWYDEHRRPMPWRASPGGRPDPYRVWLSEVMLQQTRVETVRGYYERWLERFPTLEALAEAPLDEALKAWAGLGYYSRARNLHRAVREVAERYGGRVPEEPAEFRRLPGVGRYTAGAVMSIAFDRREPVVDGNVRRVFARLLDDPDPSEAWLWRLAARLVDGPRPGDLNQAVMELGATVCTPRSPLCERCPVRSRCAAHAAGTQRERPARRAAGPVPHEHVASAIVEHGGRVLLTRRPADGLLGGLWEFHGTTIAGAEAPTAAAERGLLTALGIRAVAGGPCGVVEHAFSHLRVTYHVVPCRPVQPDAPDGPGPERAWVEPDGLDAFALSAAQKRIAALWAAQPRSGGSGSPSATNSSANPLLQ